MKFLVDNQLPQALAEHLRKRGHDCQHVLDFGLSDASDVAICRYAEAQERILITKDEDFLYLSNQPKSTKGWCGFGLGIVERPSYLPLLIAPGRPSSRALPPETMS